MGVEVMNGCSTGAPDAIWQVAREGFFRSKKKRSYTVTFACITLNFTPVYRGNKIQLWFAVFVFTYPKMK
jgi:hypothetical protein